MNVCRDTSGSTLELCTNEGWIEASLRLKDQAWKDGWSREAAPQNTEASERESDQKSAGSVMWPEGRRPENRPERFQGPDDGVRSVP